MPGDVERLRQMITGYTISQVIAVAATLDLADMMAKDAMTPEQLATKTGAHGPALTRLLHALVALGLAEEPHAGQFRMTALGSLLRKGAPECDLALMAGSEFNWRTWGDLLYAVRTGETAFEHIFGMKNFEWIALKPERAAAFDAYMANYTQRAAAAILATYDFSPYRLIVDIGGGNGVLMNGILSSTPAEGIIFDTLTGIEGAKQRLGVEVAGRYQLLAGDFFQTVPEGGDAYILKSILHDWNDHDAIAILRNCQRAMRSDSTLVVIERLLPERVENSAAHREIVMMDFGRLVEQKLSLGTDQCWVCISRRREVSHRIVPRGERRAKPRDIQLLGEEVVAQVIAFRRVHGRIELNQYVAGFDRLPVLHPNGAYHTGLERLDDLGATAWHDLSGCRCNDVDRTPPGPDQRRAEQHDDGDTDRTADRRWRCFHDLERGWQEGQLFVAPFVRAPECDDAPHWVDVHGGFSRLQGCLPAADATMHSDRLF